MKGLSTDTQKKYKIIVAIASGNLSLNELINITKIPKSTLKRQISQIRSDLDVSINFTSFQNTRGRSGHYHILSWGILDRNSFLLKHGSILKSEGTN